MDWKQRIKTAAFSAQIAVCVAVLLFCFLQIGLGKINEQDKIWYFSTITFIVGLMVKKGGSEASKQISVTGSTNSSPSITPQGFLGPPTSPDHVTQESKLTVV